MAYYRTTVTYHKTSGLPEDDVVNTYAFVSDEGADGTADTAHYINGRLAAILDAAAAPSTTKLHQYMSQEVSRVQLPTLRSFDINNPGSPLATDTMLALDAGLSTALPSEVAACLSFHGDLTGLLEFADDGADPDTKPDRPKARHRGRIFFGPLAAGAASGYPARPVADFKNALIDLANRLLGFDDTPLTNGTTATWGIYSKKDDLLRGVQGGWVDDAFDTQRRRGPGPTARVLFP